MPSSSMTARSTGLILSPGCLPPTSGKNYWLRSQGRSENPPLLTPPLWFKHIHNNKPASKAGLLFVLELESSLQQSYVFQYVVNQIDVYLFR
jgi:hypothetical protein